MSTSSERGNARSIHADILGPDEVTQLAESVSGARNIALLAVLNEPGVFYASELDEIYKDGLATQDGTQTPSGDPITFSSGALHQLKSASPTLITPLNHEGNPRWNPRGYSPTTFALERCRPLAGHVYRITRKFDIAPTDLVGYRSAPRENGGLEQTMSRLALYSTMLKAAREQSPHTRPAWSVIELADAAKLDLRVVHNHIGPLQRAHILQPKYSEKRNRYPNYSLAEHTTPSEQDLEESFRNAGWNNKKRELTRWIAEQATNGTLTDLRITSVWSAIKRHGDCERFFTTSRDSRQRAAINEVMELLAQTGFFVADSSAVRQQLSQVVLSETGAKIVDAYINAIGRIILKDQQVIDVGTRIADEVAKDSTATGWLLTVDQRKGAIAVQKSRKLKKDVLIDTLVTHGPMTTSQLCSKTGWKGRATTKTLTDLKEQGKLTSYTDGRDTYWQLSKIDNDQA